MLITTTSLSVTKNPCAWYNRRRSNLPYGAHWSWDVFPGPPDHSRYAWSRQFPINSTARRVSVNPVRPRLGMYLACGLWALLDFRSLSYDYGLMIYEGVLEAIEFWLVINGVLRKKKQPEDSPLLVRKALARWKAWMGEWRRSRCGKGEVREEVAGGSSLVPSFVESSDPRVKRWEALLPEDRRVKPLTETGEQSHNVVST